MEGVCVRKWILSLVVLFGLCVDINGQKTFRRACDCEYMVDGKCAYTLMLPTVQGEAMCPQGEDGDSSNVEMNMDVQNRLDSLRNNYTRLANMFSNQASMLNQVYSTLMGSLLSCPLLQSCAMSGGVNPSPSPAMDATDGAGGGEGEGEGNSGGMKCSDVCPEFQLDLLESRMIRDQTRLYMEETTETMTSLRVAMTTLNVTLNNLGSRIEAASGGTGNDQSATATLARLVTVINDATARGLLCVRKGPLVSGGDDFIPDDAISASSVYNEQHPASRVRINTFPEDGLSGAWCPDNSSQSNAEGEPNTPGQEWIQFDLGRVRSVYGIVTRGRSDYEQWVETFMVYYSPEDNPLDTQWIPVKDMLGIDTMIFDGNKNQFSPKYNYFDNHVVARYIRIIPLSANQGPNLEVQNMCMRADVIGCIEEITPP